MKKYSFLKIISVLLSIITLINVYIFINRDRFNFQKQLAYYELYPSTNKLSINSFSNISENQLAINLNNPLDKLTSWEIRNDSSNFTLHTGPYPIINLSEGVINYTIKPNILSDSLNLLIEYRSNKYYAQNGNTHGNSITILQANLPNTTKADDLTKWQKYHIPITKEEKKELKTILFDSIQIKLTDSSFTKANKIAKYLCKKISSSKGVPDDKMRKLSVFQQYKQALKGRKIWCGIFANIFSLFASEADIINRVVELRHRYGTFNGNIHIFNEYFIKEENRWAALDIMLNNIYYKNANNQLLNAVEVKNCNRWDNSISVLKSNFSDSFLLSPFSQLDAEFFGYYSHDKDLYYYYNINAETIYSIKEKVKRYFFKNPICEIYSDVSIVDNTPFYCKQMFALLEILLLIAFIIIIIINYLFRPT